MKKRTETRKTMVSARTIVQYQQRVASTLLHLFSKESEDKKLATTYLNMQSFINIFNNLTHEGRIKQLEKLKVFNGKETTNELVIIDLLSDYLKILIEAGEKNGTTKENLKDN